MQWVICKTVFDYMKDFNFSMGVASITSAKLPEIVEYGSSMALNATSISEQMLKNRFPDGGKTNFHRENCFIIRFRCNFILENNCSIISQFILLQNVKTLFQHRYQLQY